MDEPWSEAKHQDDTCSVVVPKGSSRRDAMQRIPYHCHGWFTNLHYETIAEHSRALRSTVSKEDFMKACSQWKSKDSDGAGDDLDAPLRHQVNSEKARVHVELLYGKTVDKVREERDKKDKELKHGRRPRRRRWRRRRSFPRRKAWSR